MRDSGARGVVSIRAIRVMPMARAASGMGGARDAIASAVAIMVIGIGAASEAGVRNPGPTEAAVSARASGLQSAAATAIEPSHRIRPLWRAQAPCRELLHHPCRGPLHR